MRLTPEEAAACVLAAGRGDERAWERLVDSYVGLIWAVARGHRLSDRDAQDVAQTTWLRLVENIGRLDQPERVGAWLATTARRECLRVLRQSKRRVLLPTWDELETVEADDGDVLEPLLRREADADVRAAVAGLPQRCQALLALLMLDPAPSYEEISAALDMPIGSIGPTRGRCLRRLAEVLSPGGIAGGPRGVFS